MADNTDPGWKRNGRNGPFDWWLSCNEHGDKWVPSCMSCGMAIGHNIEFQAKLDRERADGVKAWEVKVHCSRGERTLRAGMQWRDTLTESTWEVVEPGDGRIYSPSGLGGTATFWCKPVDEKAKKLWRQTAREDGCVSFCGDSIAPSLISTPGVKDPKPQEEKRK